MFLTLGSKSIAVSKILEIIFFGGGEGIADRKLT